jgi:ribosomal protein L7/L12
VVKRIREKVVLFSVVCAAVVLVVTLALGASAGNRASAQERRLARLEAELAELARHSGVKFDESAARRDEIANLVLAGRKLEAIRVYREVNPGAGLREAKEVIDNMAQTSYNPR